MVDRKRLMDTARKNLAAKKEAAQIKEFEEIFETAEQLYNEVLKIPIQNCIQYTQKIEDIKFFLPKALAEGDDIETILRCTKTLEEIKSTSI